MELEGTKVALLATNGFEDSELAGPLDALVEAGATVEIISEDVGVFTGKNGLEVEADLAVEDADVTEYDGLLLPGGTQNPDTLRTNLAAVEFVQQMYAADKPVAAICHAPWLLVEAGVLEGKTITSWPSLATDIKNAGGVWVDEEVAIDGNLITSRKPDDVPAFSQALIDALK